MIKGKSDKEIFRDKVYKKLKDKDEKYIRIFAIRVAFRRVMRLSSLPVRGDKSSRKFFYYLFVRLMLSLLRYKIMNLKKAKETISNIFTVAYAAYADTDDTYAIYEAFSDENAVYAYAYPESCVYPDAYAADANHSIYEAAYTAAAYANTTAVTADITDVNADTVAATAAAPATAADYQDILNDLDVQKSLELNSKPLFYDNNAINFEEVCKYFIDINKSYRLWTEYLLRPVFEGNFDDIDNKFLNIFATVNETVVKQKDAVILANHILDGISGKLGEVNVARVILLGSGGAGKTSLVRNLKKPKSCKHNEVSTPRIEISSWSVDDVEVKFWDFGGQVIMHSTHTFFLSSKSLYIIVCNHRLDEQPDAWLEILKSNLMTDKKYKVIVVYTHCDSIQEIQESTFIRKNALQRVYGDRFEFEYFALSNTEICEQEYDECFDKALFDFTEATKEQIKSEGSQKSSKAYQEISDMNTKNISTFSELKEFRERADTKSDLSDKDFFTMMIEFGYIFSAKPRTKETSFLDDDKYIWQKHWLTFGVYELINSQIAIGNHGRVLRKDFDNILKKDETRYINRDGEILFEKKDDDDEKILYDKEGIELLYEIVCNYNWAILSHERSSELIFPHAVCIDEPENLDKLIINTKEDDTRVIHIVFDPLPKDIFFRFVALCEKHIDNYGLLWRSGVVLYDFLDKSTYATVIMDKNIMKVCVKGKYHLTLMQFVSSYILILLREYKNISAHIYQGIKDNSGKIQMVDTNLMSILDTHSGEFINNIHKSMKESSVANTYNINISGDVKNSNFGDGNTIKIHNDIDRILTQLKSLNQSNDLKRVVKEGEELKNVDTKSSGFIESLVKWSKNIKALDNGADILATYGGDISSMVS